MLTGRRTGFLAGLFLCAHLACILPAAAQNSARLEDAARWAVRSAIPDGIDDWPVFTDLRLESHVDRAGRAVVVACGTLEFADPSAGRTHFLVLLAPGAREWREPLAAPIFFGSHRAEGAVPIAALCDGAGRQQSPDADLRAALATLP